MGTVDDVELTDSTIEPERLLYRLFHEHGVRVFDSTKVADDCACSKEKVRNMLESMSAEEQAESVEDGKIRVTCEFCSTSYDFDPSAFESVH